MMGNSLGAGGMILAGAIVGGVANTLAGGDFVRGFVEGLIVSALNHWNAAVGDNVLIDYGTFDDKRQILLIKNTTF